LATFAYSMALSDLHTSHDVPKILACAPKTRCRSPGRNPQVHSDLRQRQLLEFEEYEDEAKVDGKSVEDITKDSLRAALVDQRLSGRQGGLEGVHVLFRRSGPPARRAACLRGDPHSRREEEGHFGARHDLLEASRKDAQDLLRRIFCVRIGDPEISDGAPDEVVVSIDDETQTASLGCGLAAWLFAGRPTRRDFGRTSSIGGRAGRMKFAERHGLSKPIHSVHGRMVGF
jgi:hypothetical protein